MSEGPAWMGLLLDATPRAVGIFRDDGVCVAANRRFTQWAGASLQLSPGEGAAELLERCGYRRTPEGLFEGKGRTLRAEVERQEGFIGVFLDEARARGHDPRLRGRFFSVASHDLRGALANVRSYASLLKSPRFGLDEKASKAVDTIARNSDRALALSEDIFDVLKAETGSLRSEVSAHDPTPLIAAAIETVRPLAEEKSLIVEAGPASPQALLDPDRFTRAVRSLLVHAIGRSEPGKRVGVTVSGKPRLQISVWDEAPPMPPSAAGFTFDRDARVAQERKLGAGFSLALAEALARAQGGEVGHGLDEHGRQAFFFTLPLA